MVSQILKYCTRTTNEDIRINITYIECCPKVHYHFEKKKDFF